MENFWIALELMGKGRLLNKSGYHNSVDIMKKISYTIISKSEGEPLYEMSVLWSREYQSH